MIDSRAWDVVVVGGTNTDHLVRAPALPEPGATVQGDVYVESPGGKGANQALACARLGARAAFVSRVGAEARGDAAIAALEAEGVDASHVARDEDAPTGVALIAVDASGEKSIVTAPGANHRVRVADVEEATRLLHRARVVLLQLELPLDAVEAAVRAAHAGGARVVLDPAPPPSRPLAEDVLRLVDLIRPDAGEARALTGIEVRDRASARDAAEVLLRRGVGAACVQAGSAGDLLVWRGGERWLPRLPVRSVDATGAGDAFAAALAVMLAEGRPLDDAGPFASAAAALTTTKLGAQAALPRRDEVEALLLSAGLPVPGPRAAVP
ncbi:MAG TPA: ribokinase [Gemmatimonadaceae bacterium]|nr:ribokinase [Gemmatimonadaceae bacterium]